IIFSIASQSLLTVAPKPILIYVIAPPMECWGLERLVQSAHPRLELAGSSPTVDESVEALGQVAPHVVLLDLEEDQADEAVKTLQEAGSAKILIISGSADLEMLDRAVLSGARGVVLKKDSPELLLKAIEKIHEGELWIDRRALGRIFMEMARQKASRANDPSQGKIATLTLRERKTIAAVASDATVPAKVIAERLCISEFTLRNQLTSVYAKLGLSNRLDLYAFAIRHSLTDPN
ncbi:MAG: response regulator transcription factor, partial [Ramlibacter sp.]|nr:response regulator transcription factor [Ramlibacter sp.]